MLGLDPASIELTKTGMAPEDAAAAIRTVAEMAEQKPVSKRLDDRARRRRMERQSKAYISRQEALKGVEGLMPNARELFPYLQKRLLDSRPVLGYRYRTRVGGPFTFEPMSSNLVTKSGRPFGKGRYDVLAVHGAPTFENRIDEMGAWV